MGRLDEKGERVKKKKPTKFIDTDNSMMIIREKKSGGRLKRVK